MKSGIRNILVPTDFSPGSAHALKQAVVLARSWGAALSLLYVVDLNLPTPPAGPADPEKLKADLWTEGLANLGHTASELAGAGVQVRTLVRQGLPCEEIAAAARVCDLIVIGKGKSKPFWHWFSRNTVKRVLNLAPCPVMVVTEGSKEFSKA